MSSSASASESGQVRIECDDRQAAAGMLYAASCIGNMRRSSTLRDFSLSHGTTSRLNNNQLRISHEIRTVYTEIITGQYGAHTK